MELILEIKVKICSCDEVKGSSRSVTMLGFTGTAEGPYFGGRVIGRGIDTQKTDENGVTSLSARYMLEGRDVSGENCRIFIENNSSADGFTPVIVTDSKALAHWERSPLTAEITPSGDGVTVKIFIIR